MSRYRHLFFDLDHTLWDFTANSRSTLAELYADAGLGSMGVASAEVFIEVYEEVNQGLWRRYEAGRLHRDVLRVLRFRNTLLHFGVRDDKLAGWLGSTYLERSPVKPGLMPGAAALLSDLRERYVLHIITNGFSEVQTTKLERSGIADHFSAVITSEQTGVGKPDPRIFAHALRKAKATAQESLMIGDSVQADMAGARAAGWDHVHFAAEVESDPLATYRVEHMDELRAILL